jgi:hypothetical protein
MSEPTHDLLPLRKVASFIRVGVVFAAFPAKDLTPYKYFLLVLNRLQRSCEFELFDADENDEFVRLLADGAVDADEARKGIKAFGARLRAQIDLAIHAHDLAVEQPDQIILVTGVTLSDHHYLIRRGRTTMLALGDWEKSMAPPSLAEFLQLLVLRAPYSAIEGEVWNGIHLGNRGCIFDFTENLENTRFIALAGVGVCSKCAAALEHDGFPNAAVEIQRIAGRDWRGDRATPGTPTNIMERLGYPLFLTKGFEPSSRERLRLLFTDEAGKELVKLVFLVLVAGLCFLTGWKLK